MLGLSGGVSRGVLLCVSGQVLGGPFLIGWDDRYYKRLLVNIKGYSYFYKLNIDYISAPLMRKNSSSSQSSQSS